MQTKSKKDAARTQFETQAAGVIDSNQVIELEKQYQEKLTIIDKEAYKERLNLVTVYFAEVVKESQRHTEILLTQDKTGTTQRETAILDSHRLRASKTLQLFRAEQQGRISQAQTTLQGVHEQLPQAQEAYRKANSNAAIGVLSPDALKQANDVKDATLKIVTDLQEKEADATKSIAEAKQALRDKEIEQLNALKDKTIELAQQTFTATKEIQDNKFAYEAQQLSILQRSQEIANQQKIESINATAGYQVTKDNMLKVQAAQSAAEQNALQQQQNQLALKKAQYDKKMAEDGILLNTALALSKVAIMYAAVATLPFAIAETAVIMAIGAAQYAAASSVQLPQFEQGGITSTPYFIAGEKRPEIGTTPSGDKMLFDKPGVYSAPIGTDIRNVNGNDNLLTWAASNVMNRPHFAQPTTTENNGTNELIDKIDELIDVSRRGRVSNVSVVINAQENKLQYKRQ